MKKLSTLLLAAIMLCGCISALAEAPNMAYSYCNPLNLSREDVSVGTSLPDKEFPVLDAQQANDFLAMENWTYATGRSMVRLGAGVRPKENDCRTTADITVVQIADGTLVMHTTGSMQTNDQYGVCWTSTDYLHWEYREMNLCVTAPTFVEVGDKYYMAGNNSDVYVSDYPWGPWESIGKFKMLDGTERGFSDVGFFLDDDGRLYLSYSIGSPIMGCELNPEKPTELLTEPVILWENDSRNWYERFGSGCQNSVTGYTEGSQIFKYNGVYYLQVATNGTENINYCICMKKSTEGPLTGYERQGNNPVAYNTSNFVPGAGHGSFMVDQDNNLVLFYTQIKGFDGGRTVGMDVCYVDENGDVCVKITDTPQLAPNLVVDASKGSDLGLAQLCTIGNNFWCSSFSEGHSPFYAFDANCMTWWQPTAEDEAPVIMANLRGIYDVYSVQLGWKEIGNFTRYNAVQFKIEYFDLDANDWALLYDGSENDSACTFDYVTFDAPVRTIAVRLTLLGATENIPVGVTGFRIFGENYTLAEEHHRWEGYPEL